MGSQKVEQNWKHTLTHKQQQKQQRVSSSNIYPAFFFLVAFAKCWEFSPLVHKPILLRTVLTSSSCGEPLCEGIARLPCPINPQPFFLNCQQRQLVPHVVSLHSSSRSQALKMWPKCKLACRQDLGCEFRGNKFKYHKTNISPFIPCPSWHALYLLRVIGKKSWSTPETENMTKYFKQHSESKSFKT